MASLFQNPNAPVTVRAPQQSPQEMQAGELAAQRKRQQELDRARQESLRASGYQAPQTLFSNLTPEQQRAFLEGERLRQEVNSGQVPTSVSAPKDLAGDVLRFANAGAQVVMDPAGSIFGKDSTLSRINPLSYPASLMDETVDSILSRGGGSGIQGGPILPGTTFGQDMQGQPPATAGRQIANTARDVGGAFANAAGGVADAVKRVVPGVWDGLQGPQIGHQSLPQLPPPQGRGTAPGGVLTPDAQGALDRAATDSRSLTMGAMPAPVTTPAPGPDPAQQDILRQLLATISAPQGPSEAVAALKLAQAENAGNLLGAARSAGTAGDRAVAIGNALFGGARQAQMSSGQAAQLIAQESAARRGQQLQGLGTAGELAGAARSGDILLRGQTLDSAARDADRTIDAGRLGLDTQTAGQEFALGLGELADAQARTDLQREAENRMRVQGKRTLFDQLVGPTGDLLAWLAANTG